MSSTSRRNDSRPPPPRSASHSTPTHSRRTALLLRSGLICDPYVLLPVPFHQGPVRGLAQGTPSGSMRHVSAGAWSNAPREPPRGPFLAECAVGGVACEASPREPPRGPFLAACAVGGVACAALFHQGKPVQPPRNSPASRANSAARRRRRCHTGREPVRLTARSRSLSATLAASTLPACGAGSHP